MQVNNKKYHKTGKQSGENKRFLGFAGCDIIKSEKTTGGVTSMKKLYFSLIYLAVSVMLLIGLAHDAFLYKETVVKIRQAETVVSEEKDGTMYEQTLEAQILNGAHKGQTITLKNLYSRSLTVDEKYKKGDQVFVTLTGEADELEGKITGLKRDSYVLAVLLLFVYLLCMMAGKKGIATILSAGVNILLFYLALCQYEKGTYVLPVTILVMILFAVCSLLIVSGWNRVTAAAVLATLLTVAAAGVFYFVVLKLAGDPEYFMMEYTEYLNNTSQFGMLFFAQVLIGGLGAVMDVAISITATAGELVYVNPGITKESLYDGIRHVADDIMGTMINVLFLSYFCGSIPLILIKMINHYGFTEIFKFHIPFELIQFLMGSIAILISIPISLAVSVRLLKGKEELA